MHFLICYITNILLYTNYSTLNRCYQELFNPIGVFAAICTKKWIYATFWHIIKNVLTFYLKYDILYITYIT